MCALIAEHIENKFLNIEFFWKDIENNTNTLRIYYFDFSLYFENI
jgi:hypothetical protein